MDGMPRWDGQSLNEHAQSGQPLGAQGLHATFGRRVTGRYQRWIPSLAIVESGNPEQKSKRSDDDLAQTMVLVAKDQDAVQSLQPPLRSDDRNSEQEEFINALNALGRKRLAYEMKTWRSPAFQAVMHPINSSSPKPREDRSKI